MITGITKLQVGVGALFSDDKAFRFALWRVWTLSAPSLMLIGLNPSTANATTDDPTIRRIRGLAMENHYGGFYMTNLYPFVTPYPQALMMAKEQLPENDLVLQQVRNICQDVVFCWGNFATYGRCDHVTNLFPGALCFGKNSNGSPKHPLYLPKSTKLTPF